MSTTDDTAARTGAPRDPVTGAAERLDEAHRTGVPCAPVRDLLPPGDLEAAYAVQSLLTEGRLARGKRITGWKVGLTSTAVQRQLGVATPDFGALLDDTAVPDGAEIPWGSVLQPRAEAEVALVLESDLVHDRHTVADVIRATAFVLPAIEVVGSRIRDWDISAVDTIADNASSGAYVLGTRPVLLRELDLRSMRHGVGAPWRARLHRCGCRLPRKPTARGRLAGGHTRPARQSAAGRGHGTHRRARSHGRRRAG